MRSSALIPWLVVGCAAVAAAQDRPQEQRPPQEQEPPQEQAPPQEQDAPEEQAPPPEQDPPQEQAPPQGQGPAQEEPAEAPAELEPEPGPGPEPEPEPLPTVAPTPLPEEDDGMRLGVGWRLGASHQPYQWMTGFHLSIRNITAEFLEADASLMAGLAAEHFTLRAALHGKAVLRLGDFRAHLLVGPAAFVYVPRGKFAEWCEKLDLQECGGSAFGVEVGVGVGWSAFGLDVYLATGELPLATIVGTVTWMF